MPLPMVHLSVAVKYMEQEKIANASRTFLLGNIAPDSIHMRENTTRTDKDNTHFIAEDDKGINLKKVKDLYPYYMKQKNDEQWQWFIRGYFMHVLTDYYWFRSVHPTFKAIPEVNEKTPQEISQLYYRETDQIDFNIFKQKTWSGRVWEDLNKTKSVDFSPLLTADEIGRWRDRTFAFFQDETKEPKMTPVYITDQIVEEFIDKTVGHMRELYAEWDSDMMHKVDESTV